MRHAAHELPSDVLVGRKQGVNLSAEGRADAARLARRLAAESVDAVYTSPRERAHQTAEVIANAHAIHTTVTAGLDELDYGGWTGRSFAELEQDERWTEWNSTRSTARPPDGESMVEVQRRIVAELRAVHEGRPCGTVAMVTHADVIRAALLFYLEMSPDLSLRLQIDAGSLTIIELRIGSSPVLRCMNDTSHLTVAAGL